MKKIVIFLSMVVIGYVGYAQIQNVYYYDDCEYLDSMGIEQNPCKADTSNLLIPRVFDDGCVSPCLGGLLGSVGISSYSQRAIINDSLDLFYAVRQPYHTDSAVKIDGVVFYGLPLNGWSGFTILDTTFYFQIMDSQGNILRQARYDTLSLLGQGGLRFVDFYKIAFDNPVVVTGNFYVCATFGHPEVETFGVDALPSTVLQLGGKALYPECDMLKVSLPQYQNLGDTIWQDSIYMADINGYPPQLACAVCMYPRIDTSYSSSAIAEINLTEDNVDIYPNPSDDVLNITCKNIVNKVEIVDLQGQKQIERVFDCVNVQLDISSLPSSAYFAVVYTDKGIVKKKFVKK